MSPSTSPSATTKTTTKTTTTTTTTTPPRPVSPGYRLLTPSELSKILNQPTTHPNHTTTTNLIPTLPLASSSSTPISSLHHHHLQPLTDVYHAPKPLIPSSSSSSMILGHGLDSEHPLTPGLFTPTEGDLGSGMDDSGLSKSTIHPVEFQSKSKSNSDSNSSGGPGHTLQPQQTDRQSKPPTAPLIATSANTIASTSAAAAAVGNESSRTLCVRHQSMADQGVNGKLQQVSLPVVRIG
jgi:hypothetical protein